jgi:hypothetical protein
MNITAVSKASELGQEFAYQDRTRGMDRSGLINFRAPFVISLQSQIKQLDVEGKLNVVTIPTKPGWSRLIVCTGFGMKASKDKKQEASDKTKKPKRNWKVKVFAILPRWVVHQLTHAIVDGDVSILHNQEQVRAVARQVDFDGYCMPASADRCITPIRQWVLKYAHIPTLSNIAGKVVLPESPIKRSVLFDRWSQHTDQCKHCHGAFDGIQKWRRNNFLAMAASIVFAKFLAARFVMVGCLAMWRLLYKAEQSMTKGGCDHYKNH